MEVELEHLDALLQQMACHVNRVAVAREINAPKPKDWHLVPEEERPPSPELLPALRPFVELTEPGSYAQLKAARAELETVVSRHKETEHDD